MTQLSLRLLWPVIALLGIGAWMFADMHSVPDGDTDFQWRDLSSFGSAWLNPMAFSPRRLRETALAPAVRLNRIHCVDDGKCWVVGRGGLLLSTSNGGDSWEAKPSHTTNDLNDVYFGADSKRGWIVGSHGTILFSTDGGDSWRPSVSSPFDVELTNVYFDPDGSNGWAAGKNRVGLISHDGGLNWAAAANPTQSSGNAVHITTAGDGWTFDGNQILVTHDGGMSWAPQGGRVSIKSDGGSTLTPSGIFFTADGTKGWAVGYRGTILATQDNGITWKAQPSGITSDLTSVYFGKSGRRGWVVGEDGVILATRDGGASWHTQAGSFTNDFNGVCVSPDGSVGWAVGQHGTVLTTKNAGATWEPRSSGTNVTLNDVFFVADGTRGWIVGDHGTALLTADRGSTWRQLTLVPPTVDLIRVIFAADGRKGWILGSSSTVLTTRDAGNSWQASHIVMDNPNIKGLGPEVAFSSDGSKAWAAPGLADTVASSIDGGLTWKSVHTGFSGTPMAVFVTARGDKVWVFDSDDRILVSTDDGLTWKRIEPVGGGAFLTNTFFTPDGTRGWAVGSRGAILSSHDGGVTWQPQTTGFSNRLTRVIFTPNGTKGWALGSGGAILASADGGVSWQAQVRGTPSDLNSLYFTPSGLGWAVGEGGTILFSRDAGDSWQVQPSGATRSLTRVLFNDTGTKGWILGSRGTLLTTSDQGLHWRPLVSGTERDLSNIFFSRDGKKGWILGREGTFLVTTDGGASWQAQQNGPTTDRTEIYFTPDRKTVWRVGYDRSLNVSHDEGLTWPDTTQSAFVGTPFAGITDTFFLPDGSQGWAVEEGVILSSRDQGAHWRVVDTEPNRILRDLSFNADGSTGWVIGSHGPTLITRDGGVTWHPQTTDTVSASYLLTSVWFDASGNKGWAVGNGGAILISTDAGAHWNVASSGSGGDLRSVYFNADGSRGWVLGRGGIMLTSRDGGATWAPQPLTHAPRLDPRAGAAAILLPRPIFWVLCFAVLTWLLMSIFQATADPDALRHADTGGVHDNPVEHPLDDRLGHAPLGRAIAMLLLSRDTRSPLAVAVCAPWGVGKSSLLHMVSHELKRRGAQPIWFNAWHFREDTQMLAALIEHIKDQTRINGLSPGAWVMRSRLLWHRVLRHWVVPGVIGSVALLAYLRWPASAHSELLHWGRARIATLPAGLADGWQGVVSLSRPIAALIAAIIAVVQLRKSAAFTDKLVRMARNGIRGFKTQTNVGDLRNEAGLRYRFQREFADLCRATGPGRLVLLVDDLDRCDPAQISTVINTLNFLFSNATCNVVLGMDWRYVQTAVGLANKDMAEALGVGAPTGFSDGAQTRFGEGFLRKIVQLRITLPQEQAAAVIFHRGANELATRSPLDYASPLESGRRYLQWAAECASASLQYLKSLPARLRSKEEGEQVSVRQWCRRALRGVTHGIGRVLKATGTATGRWEPGTVQTLVGLIICGTLVFAFVRWIGREMTPETVGNSTVMSIPQSPDLRQSFDPSGNPERLKDPRQADEPSRDASTVNTFLPARNTASSAVWWGTPALGVALSLWFLLWAASQVRDSDAFRNAVTLWGRRLATRLGTPREWRRFQNMARFAAMRVRVAHGYDGTLTSGWRHMRQRHTAWVRHQPRPILESEREEALLVSLLAADIYCEGRLLGHLSAKLSSLGQALESSATANAYNGLLLEKPLSEIPAATVLTMLLSPAPTAEPSLVHATSKTERADSTDTSLFRSSDDWATNEEPLHGELRNEVQALIDLPESLAPWIPAAHLAYWQTALRSKGWAKLSPAEAETKRATVTTLLNRWERFYRFATVIDAALLVRRHEISTSIGIL